MPQLPRTPLVPACAVLGLFLLGPFVTAAPQQSTARIEVLPSEAFDQGAPEHPELGWAGSPEPGGSFELLLRDVSALGVLAWSGSPAPTPVLALGGLLHVDAAFQTELVFPDGAGQASGLLAVDVVPESLIGLDAVAQAASLDFSYPGLWRLTDAHHVRFGWTPPLATSRPTGSVRLTQAITSLNPETQLLGAVDFDGDGRDELILAGLGGPVVLRGDERGELVASSLPDSMPLFISGQFYAAGDFDGDGLEEALVGYQIEAGPVPSFNSVPRLLGEDPQSGDLVVEQDLSAVVTSGLAAAGDLDLDGFDDLVQLDTANAELLVHFGSAAGVTSPGLAIALGSGGAEANDLAIADIDGDGFPEAIALSGGDVLAWGAGGGPGGVSMIGAQPTAADLEIAHLDGDGIADVLVLAVDTTGSQVLARLSSAPSAGFGALYTTGEVLAQVHAQKVGSTESDRLALLPNSPAQETIELRFDTLAQLVGEERWERGQFLRNALPAQVDGDAAQELVVVDTSGYLSICESAEPLDEPLLEGVVGLWKADVTGDGVEDQVIVYAADQVVRVVDGLTGAVIDSDLYDDFAEVQVATLGDFDGDGHLDAVLGAKKASYSNLRLFIGFGDGQGHFQVMPGLENGPSPVLGSSLEWVALELGDFDGDGATELAHVWARPFAQEVLVQSIDLAELLAGASSTTPTGPFVRTGALLTDDFSLVQVRSGDLNGDGVDDLAWNLEGGEALLGSAVGWLDVSMAASAGGSSVKAFEGLAVGDVDGDGRDEVLGNRGGALTRFDFEAAPLGFQETDLDFSAAGFALELADANGDGILDVLFAGLGPYLTIRLGGQNGEESFPRVSSVYTGVFIGRIFVESQPNGPDLLRVTGLLPGPVRVLPNL